MDPQHRSVRSLTRASCLAGVLLLTTALPGSAETILWLSTPFPPVNILDGPLAGQGLNDGIREHLETALHGYEYRQVEGNLARLVAMAREGQTVCAVNLLKTAERERDLIYSEPATVSLTLHLILRPETWTQLGEPTALSVEALAGADELRGATELGRSYTAAIDHIIADSRTLRPMAAEGQQLFRMLLQGRIGYTLEYPFVIEYLAREHSEPWVAVPIAEAPAFVIGHVACARTPAGQKVVARVDEALADLRTRPEYLDVITRWHPPEAAERVRRHFMDTLRERGLLPTP